MTPYSEPFSMSEPVYNLQITRKQAEVLQEATELLSRLQSGQIRVAFDHLPLRKDLDWGAYWEILDNLTEQMPLILKQGIDGYRSSFGVGSRELPESSDIAWDLHCVLRHRLSWDRAIEQGIVPDDEKESRNWSKMLGVSYDEPMNWGSEPLARVSKLTTEDSSK